MCIISGARPLVPETLVFSPPEEPHEEHTEILRAGAGLSYEPPGTTSGLFYIVLF